MTGILTASGMPVPILLVSPFIDPQAVGEPRWCYDLARAIAARTETIIIAQTPRKRDYTITDLFPESIVYEHNPWKLDFVPPRIHAMFKPNYLQFYIEARRALKQSIDPALIACAHHFGPLALRFPSPLRGLGIPYVIGPLGGSLPTPPAFAGERSRQPWYYRFRDFDGMRFRHDPMLRSSYEEAACVVGVAPYVRGLLSSMKLRGFETRPEIAAAVPGPEVTEALRRRRERQEPIRFLIVSRLVFSKGVQFALQAAARLPSDIDWRIDILGDGTLRSALARQIIDLGLSERVTLHGHVARLEVDKFYRDADVFLFPSIREPSGAVVFEAMSWGLPMIVADYGGPSRHVRDSYGRRIPVDSREAFVIGLAEAMTQLSRSPATRTRMGAAAACAAGESESLDAMATYFLDLYDRVRRGEVGRG